MHFCFLPDDLERLEKQIAEAREQARSAGGDMGKSCQESAETFHDNFPYEDAERRHTMWAKRVRELERVLQAVRVVNPELGSERVGIGKTVTYVELLSQEEHTLRIGSFMTFDQPDTVAYNAPIAKLLIGARVGDVREGKIAHVTQRLQIKRIE